MKLLTAFLFAAILILGCASENTEKASNVPKKFIRVFAWASLNDEAIAMKFKDIGVTDVTVNTPAQVALAKKYGFRCYAGFGPRGAHAQKMSPEETALQKRLNGEGLPPLEKNATAQEKTARSEKIIQIRKELKTQFGGEPVADAPEGDVLNDGIACFTSDKGYEKSKEALKKACSLEGIDGISFDYIGYANYKGCYCDDCLALYKKYIADNKLPDNDESRNDFYLKQLVDYNNAMVDYVKSLNPDFKVMAHIYPVFMPEPLYGNRLKVDYCGQTAAWYFLWDKEKIRSYSKIITSEQNKYFPDVKGIAFLGYYYKSPSFPEKSPERIELELKAMLEGGSEYLMVCSMNSTLGAPAVTAVFKKYCNP